MPLSHFARPPLAIATDQFQRCRPPFQTDDDELGFKMTAASLCQNGCAKSGERKGRRRRQRRRPPRTMQDIVKGWWLFNNEIHASGGENAELSVARQIPHHILHRNQAPRDRPDSPKVSLNEGPEADG